MNVIKAWGFGKEDADLALEHYYEYLDQFDNEYSFKVRHYIDSARISCFCKKVNNLLMWAHYADGLRGFAIEFDKGLLLKERWGDSRILQVKYRRAPAIIDGMVYEVANDQIWYHEMAIEETEVQHKYSKDAKQRDISQEINDYNRALREARKRIFNLYSKMLATKPLDWKYEEEYRLIFFSDKDDLKGEVFNYPKGAIKSFVLGEKMPFSDQEKLKNIIKEIYPNVSIHTAKRDKKSFRVRICESQ